MARQLLWWSPNIMLMHARPEDRIAYNDILSGKTMCGVFRRYPGLEWHLSMRRAIGMASLMVDGTGLSRQYGDGVRASRIASNNGQLSVDASRGKILDRNFDDMVNMRLSAALDHAARIGASRIYLAYSGGSDSVLILAAIMRSVHARGMLEDGTITILANRHSQREDPEIWERIINSGAHMRLMDWDSLLRDEGNWMLLSGEGECYGTFFIPAVTERPPNEHVLTVNWRDQANLFLRRDFTGLAWDYFRSLMDLSPFPVRTLHQSWWWFEHCVDRQDDFIRHHAWTTNPVIRNDCIGHGGRMFHFFGGQDFLDHAAYVVLEGTPSRPDMIKHRSDEYTSRWLGHTETKPRPKLYSQDRILRIAHKQRIFDDLTWDDQATMEGYCS